MSGRTNVAPLPFPYFGGKSTIVHELWLRFGKVKNLITPFFGGGPEVINCPYLESMTVTVNDSNAWLTNFWRAVKADPAGVAKYADYPVSELDLHARGTWLFYRERVEEWIEKMRGDPDFYDVKSAGWWVWGQCQWIGSGWQRMESRVAVKREIPKIGAQGPGIARPHLGRANGMVWRQAPNLSNQGMGVGLKRPRLAGWGDTEVQSRDDLIGYLTWLQERLRRVRICCGDWKRVCDSKSTTTFHGLTAVFLDPPYSTEERDANLYQQDEAGLAAEVREWALAHGDNPMFRIALCGYESEHDAFMPVNWSRYRWKTSGGYANIGNGRGKENAKRETVWFSPHCLGGNQRLPLGDGA